MGKNNGKLVEAQNCMEVGLIYLLQSSLANNNMMSTCRFRGFSICFQKGFTRDLSSMHILKFRCSWDL